LHIVVTEMFLGRRDQQHRCDNGLSERVQTVRGCDPTVPGGR